jgi:Arc/MetJ-type ribon-helix-helix transcriptional regulator
MTVTVKLDPALEERLRQRAASRDITTSDVIRAALAAYLDDDGRRAAEPPSAFALGQGLFGRHGGADDLAANRKQALAQAWGDKHRTPRA